VDSSFIAITAISLLLRIRSWLTLFFQEYCYSRNSVTYLLLLVFHSLTGRCADNNFAADVWAYK